MAYLRINYLRLDLSFIPWNRGRSTRILATWLPNVGALASLLTYLPAFSCLDTLSLKAVSYYNSSGVREEGIESLVTGCYACPPVAAFIAGILRRWLII